MIDILPTLEDLRDNFHVIVTTNPRCPMKSIGGIPFNEPYVLGNGYGIRYKELVDYHLLRWIHEDSKDYKLELRKR